MKHFNEKQLNIGNGRSNIYFTPETAMDMLNVCKTKAIKQFMETETHGLLVRTREFTAVNVCRAFRANNGSDIQDVLQILFSLCGSTDTEQICLIFLLLRIQFFLTMYLLTDTVLSFNGK